MTVQTLPCIKCGKTMESVLPEPMRDINQPRQGVVVHTTGNYGSEVWDTFGYAEMEFNICDPCLTEAGEKGRVLVTDQRRGIRLLPQQLIIGYREIETDPVVWTTEWNWALDDDADETVTEEDVPSLREDPSVTITFDPEHVDNKNFLKEMEELGNQILGD